MEKRMGYPRTERHNRMEQIKRQKRRQERTAQIRGKWNTTIQVIEEARVQFRVDARPEILLPYSILEVPIRGVQGVRVRVDRKVIKLIEQSVHCGLYDRTLPCARN